MKRFLLGLPIVIASLFALTTGAWAETNIVANSNHDFVASGKTFSAGTYKVFRLSAEMLVLRGEETGASVFLFPSTQNQAVPWQLQVKLMQVGDVYYLSEVETDVWVYTFPAPQELTRLAKLKDRTAIPASGSK